MNKVFRGAQPAPMVPMRIAGVEGSTFRSIRVMADGTVCYDLTGEPPNDPDVGRAVLRPNWRLEYIQAQGGVLPMLEMG